ncbi:hypothetical protein AMECASPLE_026030 [Ameca splendens]|uniref:Uncharacterized protein n=1 Tax=Ameca splendens TaxID=208324 RepID=A0ABV1A2H0_9TELE
MEPEAESAVLSGFNAPQPPGQLTAGCWGSGRTHRRICAIQRYLDRLIRYFRVGHGGYTGPILQIWG